MKQENKQLLILCGAALAVVALIVGIWAGTRNREPEAAHVEAAVTAPAAAEPVVIEKERFVEVQVEVEKEITAEIIEDGLRSMGTLITQEYYFTEVGDYESTKTWSTKIFGKEISGKVWGSDSKFCIQYDGTVSAGVDFSAVTVTRDADKKLVTVALPKAAVYNVSIDFDSFRLLGEKESLLNKTSVADYNNVLKELQSNATVKAKERGLLEQADKNAALTVKNFAVSLIGDTGYTVKVVTK